MRAWSDKPPDQPSEDSGQVHGHPGVSRVREQLAGLGVSGQVVVLPEYARTAEQAARQLGVQVGQIASSLIFAVPDPHARGGRRPLLVLTSGAHRVDVLRIASLLGVERIDFADPDLVRRSTGFAIGGVAPVGHTHPVDTLVDVALAGYDVVWAAAGHPKAVFPTRYDELLRITAGHPVEVD